MVGVTVHYWGIKAADGLLHLFEGWIIFIACAGMIALQIYFLARISGQSFFSVFEVPGSLVEIRPAHITKLRLQVPLLVCLLLLCVTAPLALLPSGSPEVIPERSRFIAFPERIGSWQGHTSLLDPETERMLRLDDYILSDYTRQDGKMVNFYVAYYASQRKGNQPHSPNDCIPGSGWKITKFEQMSYSDNGTKFSLNRAIIVKNAITQVAYYWFDERGRKIANEYLAKWYLHADAAFMNRTDGALVRLVTQIHSGETESDADRRMQTFMRDALPTLSEYLPSETTSNAKSIRFGSKDTQL